MPICAQITTQKKGDIITAIDHLTGERAILCSLDLEVEALTLLTDPSTGQYLTPSHRTYVGTYCTVFKEQVAVQWWSHSQMAQQQLEPSSRKVPALWLSRGRISLPQFCGHPAKPGSIDDLSPIYTAVPRHGDRENHVVILPNVSIAEAQ